MLYQVIAARASAPAATRLCFWDKVLQRGKGRSARTFVLRLRLDATKDHARTPRVRVEGKPAAYLCIGTACSLPLSEPEALAATLARPSAGA